MTSAVFYVDESGDLGWTFTAPYRRGGSSRYLTIATLVCPSEKKHLPKRLIANLYKKFGWDVQTERKWSDMTLEEKEWFANETHKLLVKHPEIKLFAITVSKEKVVDRMRRDSNKLYNYMICLSLIDEMTKFDEVVLVPDPRSIKVKSGNSLHDYLDIHLAFEKRVSTILHTSPCDSACSRNIQFSDMLAGLVQNHFENSNSNCWHYLKEHIRLKKLFF